MTKSSFGPRWISAIGLMLTLLWMGVFTPSRVYAAFYSVDTIADDPTAIACTSAPYNCSLRGAIALTNANGGDNVIALPAFGSGPYVLTYGVLNITNNLTINGAGASITIISGGHSSPIFMISAPNGGLTLRAVTLADGLNTASNSDGGCILNAGALTLNYSTVTQCSAGRDGGGIFNSPGGTVQLNNSIISNNVARRDCGGICDYGAWVTLSGSTIVSNTAQTDVVGGLGTNGVVVTLTNSIVMSNTAAGDGGGLYNNKLMTLINVKVIGNNANPGGQNRGGGGLYNNAGTANISDSTFSGNQAFAEFKIQGNGVDGGGISIASGSTVNLTNDTLNQNKGRFGGGIKSSGTMTLINVTVSGNSAVSGGGGINADGAATLTNVTFSGNSSVFGTGSGIHAENTAMLMLTNTILANSLVHPNCFPTVGGSFNLSDDGSCGFGGGRNSVNNLMLAPLGNYGGPTLTHIPLLGSAAIDAGTSCTATDQRGKPRPVGYSCDVGSVERQLVDFSLLFLPLLRR